MKISKERENALSRTEWGGSVAETWPQRMRSLTHGCVCLPDWMCGPNIQAVHQLPARLHFCNATLLVQGPATFFIKQFFAAMIAVIFQLTYYDTKGPNWIFVSCLLYPVNLVEMSDVQMFYVVSLQLSTQVVRYFIKTGYGRFLLYSFKLINSYAFSYSTMYDRLNLHTYTYKCQTSKISTFTKLSVSNSMWHLSALYLNYSQEISGDNNSRHLNLLRIYFIFYLPMKKRNSENLKWRFGTLGIKAGSCRINF
jgi:hypothetical protein